MVQAGTNQSERHLLALRALLRRDFLTVPSWRESLTEAAEAARTVVCGRRAFVALRDEEGAWAGFLDDGTALDEAVVHLVGSVTLMEKVHANCEPVITSVAQPLLTRSHSIERNDVRNVLVVPVRTWSREGEQPVARAVGCLYVDRAGDAPPFEQPDIDIVLDLANLLERTLGVLRQLTVAEKELGRARRHLRAQLTSELETYQLHHVHSREPEFIRNVLEPLKRAARADRVGVLLVGPTGAGKTHLAHSFHYESRRREGPFVVFDCGQVSSSEALGAELFGFAKQSGFSAPKEGRLGKAALADGGTLFIDEIATLPLDLQQRLLRVIEKRRFTPLGTAEELEVDVQVVAASNADLAQLVREGRFREDLYWRLSEVAVRVPPLDERKADLPGLVQLFLRKAAERFGRSALAGIEPLAMERLVGFPWSRAGNTRGLENAMNRSVLMAQDDRTVLEADDLVLPDLLPEPVEPRGETAVTLRQAERSNALVDEAAGVAGREPARPARSTPLRDLLLELLGEYSGVVTKLASDSRLVAAFGLASGPVPSSTLRLRIRQLGLEDALEAARERDRVRLAAVVKALREHRSGARAASALGITRDALAWSLRQAGLSVRQVVGGDAEADEG